MVKQVLAVVLAVGLVVGALGVRSRFLQDEPAAPAAGTGEPVDPGDPPDPPPADLVVACAADLGDACPAGSDRLDLAGLLDAFRADPVAHDVLVAPTAVVELVEQSRTSRATFAEDRPVVATTPLVLATAVSVDELVADACGQAVTWTCAAALAADGDLVAAITDPRSSVAGLAAAAALTGGALGDAAFSTNDLSGAAALAWFDAAAQQVPVAADPLTDLILFGGARNTGAVATEAQALDVVGRAAGNRPDLAWPTPTAVLAVAAVAVDGADPAGAAAIGAQVGEALAAAGWRGPDGQPVVDGPPVDPAALGLPAGGVLFSLRDLWP